MNEGNVIVVDKIAFKEFKTKEANALLKKSGCDKVKRVLVILAEDNADTYRAFRNIPGVEVRVAPNKEGRGTAFSTRDVVVAHKILLVKDAVAKMQEVWNS
jgi:large subunit ribosomal protein L4